MVTQYQYDGVTSFKYGSAAVMVIDHGVPKGEYVIKPVNGDSTAISKGSSFSR